MANIPCFEIRLTTINLAKANQELLHKALDGLGLTHSVQTDGSVILYKNGATVGTVRSGVVTIRDSVRIGERDVLSAYAGEVVKAAGQRAGWQVKSSKENQYVLTRGRR